MRFALILEAVFKRSLTSFKTVPAVSGKTYNAMSVMLVSEPASAARVGQTVADILDDLEIHPFVEESVHAFMHKKLEHANRMLRFRLNMRCACSAAAAFASLGITLALILATLSGNVPPFFGICAVFAAWTLFLSRLSPMYRVCTNRLLEYYDRKHQWKKSSLVSYSRDVPLHVVGQVQALQSRIPMAQFTVHYLAEDPLISFIVPGRIEREQFFAQWDEPTFKAVRHI